MHVIMVRLLEFLDCDDLTGRSVPRLEDLPIGPKWLCQIEEFFYDFYVFCESNDCDLNNVFKNNGN